MMIARINANIRVIYVVLQQMQILMNDLMAGLHSPIDWVRSIRLHAVKVWKTSKPKFVNNRAMQVEVTRYHATGMISRQELIGTLMCKQGHTRGTYQGNMDYFSTYDACMLQ